MDKYIIGSVADFISSKSSQIKQKKRFKLNGEERTQIPGNNYRKKKEISINDALKVKNKSLEGSLSAERLNSDTTNKSTKSANLKVKTTSQLKKKRKLLESCSANDDEKSFVQKKAPVNVDFLGLKSNDSSENETENVENISGRIKKFCNKTLVKKDFLENTIFVGNIPVNYEKRKICKIFSKFGEIQSARIRCVPIADINLSKKVAAIKKKFNPKRKSLVAYVKFKSQDSVNAALKANGMIVDGHHLRIDSAENNKQRDNNKAVFVGGLPFDAEDDELWEFFEKCGRIISVHVIRDSQTSMGKGFGYVNFDSTASVELALQLDGQEFKKRIINVKRCVKTKNNYKLHSFDKKKSKEMINQLLCKRSKKFKEEQKKLKKEKKSFSSNFQGKTANIKQKKKKKLSKVALHQRKLVKILNPSKN